MKILTVYAHPEPTSLTRQLVEVSVQTLQQQGHEVLLSDLYGMHWKAVFDARDFPSRADAQRLSFVTESGHSYSSGRQAIDIASEQRKLLAADAVILQFPLWWFGMPAIFKGWVDRVFAYGLAYGFKGAGNRYRYGDGGFKGKRALLSVTVGGSAEDYSARGINGPLEQLLFPITHGTLFFPGMDVLPTYAVYGAGRITAEGVAAAKASWRLRLERLFEDAPISFRPQNGGDYPDGHLLVSHVAVGQSGLPVHVAEMPTFKHHNKSNEVIPMSKVIRFHEYGPAEVLKIEDIEVRQPGANEVRIKVAAIGMNFAEVMWRRNQYIETPQLPAGLGYEVSGTIEKLGPGVQGFKIGDKVSTFAAHNQGNYSAYGELVVMPVTSVARYPQRLTEVEAASYWVAYMTGYFALFELAKVSRGETVLITAASSSTGLAGIQLAKLAGLRVIATTRSSRKAAALKKAGAHIVIATEEENLVERVLAATNGEGAEVVYDAVGGAQLASLGSVTKRHGRLILYGFKGDGEMAVPIWDLAVRTLKFHVYKIFDFTGAPTLGIMPDPQAVERAITFINSNIEKGLLNPTVDRVFKLDDIVAAHRYVESGVQTGKIVITTQ